MSSQEQPHLLRVIWFGQPENIEPHVQEHEIELQLRDSPGLPEETDMYVLPDSSFSSVDDLLQTGKRLSFPVLFLVRNEWMSEVATHLGEHDNVCSLHAPGAVLSLRISRMLAYIRAMGMHLERRGETSLGLSCRSFFESWCEQWLESLPPESSVSFAMVNIDDYKQINEKHGYHNGDMVLQKFANLLRDAVPDAHKMTRWEGDRFFFVLPANKEKAFIAAEELRVNIQKKPVAISTYCGLDHIVPLTVSIGLVTALAGDVSLAGVIKETENACRVIKKKGGNGVSYRESREEPRPRIGEGGKGRI